MKGQHRSKKREIFTKSRREKENIDAIVARYPQILETPSSSLTSFKDFPLSSLARNGFVTPTEIQRDSLGFSLSGVDVVGAAKTGSGKTLALIIPLLECLWRNRWSRSDGLGALVISPTRELALQIFDVLNKVGAGHDFSAAPLIGGTDVAFERSRLANMNIIVCTPGRLLQHMDENSTFSCDQLQILIVDEADRILDLGFQQQMTAIMENIPRDRQTLLFSATQTKNVKDLTRLALRDPVYISVHEHARYSTPEQLSQAHIQCAEEGKISLLWSFLVNHKHKKSLIFVSSCKQARFLTDALRHLRPGVSVSGLWGTMPQVKRIAVLAQFNRKTNGAALLATDVASRGLDFVDVDWVLQLDCPPTVEDYIHRVGRTARMERAGQALLVLTPSQAPAMLASLKAANIPLTQIRVDPKKSYDIRKRLQALLIQFPILKDFAQRSFVAFLRSIHLMRRKDVFDVGSIDCAALAESYGLAVAPRVRFLRKRSERGGLNKNGTSEQGHASEQEHEDNAASASHSSFAGNEEEDDDDGDILRVTKTDVFNVLSTRSIPVQCNAGTGGKSRLKEANPVEDVAIPVKAVTKKARVKKMLKQGRVLNTKKRFDEIETEGDVPNRGFDIAQAEKEMREEDEKDRERYRQMQKTWRREKKAKMKKKREGEGRKRRKVEEDEDVDLASDDEGEAHDEEDVEARALALLE